MKLKSALTLLSLVVFASAAFAGERNGSGITCLSDDGLTGFESMPFNGFAQVLTTTSSIPWVDDDMTTFKATVLLEGLKQAKDRYFSMWVLTGKSGQEQVKAQLYNVGPIVVHVVNRQLVAKFMGRLIVPDLVSTNVRCEYRMNR